MKVYVIRYEELYSDNSFASGISYVFDSLEKAKDMLKTIKRDQTNYYIDNGWEEDYISVKESETKLFFDFSDEYSLFEIEEMELR